jgi:integrase
MATMKLTKRVVDALPIPARPAFYFDSDLKGFGLKVMPSGVKTFIVEYRPGVGGRTAPKRRVTLGRYGALTTDEAQDLAKGTLGQVAAGKDPASERAKARAELTVSDVCDLYLREGCEAKKPSTLVTDRGRIERHIKPLLGRKRISEVSRGDVERFMRDVANGKTAADVKTGLHGRAIVEGGRGTATRTVGLLGGIMSFAVSREFRGENPVRGVKRYADKKGQTLLSAAELGAIGAALRELEETGANPAAIAIVRLLALTGARKTEIASLRWSEVDLDRGYLRLGDSKTGAKVVPIGPAAQEVLASTPRIANSDYVFPASSGTSHFQGTEKVWRMVRTRAGFDKLRLHDLRHGFASVGLAGGSALPVIGAILGHADVKTTSRYAHLADDPVKKAADQISETISAAINGKASAEIVKLRG